MSVTRKDYGANAKVPASNPTMREISAINSPYSVQATGYDRDINPYIVLDSAGLDLLKRGTRVLFGNKDGYVKTVTYDGSRVLVSAVITTLDKEKNEVDTTYTKAEILALGNIFFVTTKGADADIYPKLVSSTLNETTGVWVLTFDKVIDVDGAGVDLTKITLHETGLAAANPLDDISDAVVTAGNGTTVTITLSEADRVGVVALTDVEVDVEADAFRDIDGGAIKATTDQSVTITT